MPATGFYTRSSFDGGSPAPSKILNAAGSLISVLDLLLTEGPSPWSKTVIGTNHARYTAPGGSQPALDVLDNTAHGTNFWVRLRLYTGGSPSLQVPSATQEVTGSQGYVYIRARATTATGTDYDPDWVGVRTDRFCLLHVGGSNLQPTQPNMYFVAGDFPTLSPNDPGLTGVVGQLSTLTSTITASDSTSAQNNQPASSFTYATSHHGYMDVAADGITGPVPATIHAQFGPIYGNVTGHSGDIPLGREWIVTALTTTSTSAIANNGSMRGYIPFVYSIPIYGTTAAGIGYNDTFTDANGAQYIIRHGYNNTCSVAIMTSDDEDLP